MGNSEEVNSEEVLLATHELLIVILRKGDQEVNTYKTRSRSPSTIIDGSVAPEARGSVVLGVPMGSEEFIRCFLDKTLENLRTIGDALAALENTLCKCTHVFRNKTTNLLATQQRWFGYSKLYDSQAYCIPLRNHSRLQGQYPGVQRDGINVQGNSPFGNRQNLV